MIRNHPGARHPDWRQYPAQADDPGIPNLHPTSTLPDQCLSRIGAFVILAISMLASIEASGSSNHGITAYLQGSYSEAIPVLRNRARHGFGPSQYYLGMAYLHGRGAGIDRARAYAWFATGERNGHEPSRNARRTLHSHLKVGELPRAERLAREFIARFSRYGYNPSPCYSNYGDEIVRQCGPPPA